MKAFYKIADNQAQVGSGTIIPEGFVEYAVGQEPEELQLALGLDKEAERVASIKTKAGQIILAKYPEYKQTNAQLGIYGEDYLIAMKAFITDIVKQSNELEADASKTAEDFVIEA